MHDTLSVELTEPQRELLLRGLRYVRSGVLLEQRDPTSETRREAERQLQEISDLAAQLTGAEPARV
ncbi:MAG: hypothetical protein ACREJB_14020 [Planctomycetaceae bacterium]